MNNPCDLDLVLTPILGEVANERKSSQMTAPDHIAAEPRFRITEDDIFRITEKGFFRILETV